MEFSYHSTHLTSPDFISIEIECALIDRSHGKLGRFTVHNPVHIIAATNHSALRSDEMTSVEMRSDEVR